jgi:hypothetical protein
LTKIRCVDPAGMSVLGKDKKGFELDKIFKDSRKKQMCTSFFQSISMSLLSSPLFSLFNNRN